MKLARLHKLAKQEPYWHVDAVVFIAIGLQFGLSNKLTFVSRYLMAILECLLLVLLTFSSQSNKRSVVKLRRTLAIGLIAIISLANISSLFLVVRELVGGKQVTGTELIVSALAIYLTNIIIFGLWYWELDDHPLNNDSADNNIDFMFPQMTSGDEVPSLKYWNPTFLDYLYVSVTNASAFSPTDTMPLTHRAKALMGLQSTVSFITVALVAARAVNILS
jgi:uncharacterized membrane protein